MADVFVSYSREDFHAVERVVRFLKANKISVWWDPAIAPGERFGEAIPDALKQSCCAVVAWSRYSVKSDWVLDEAGEARKRGILVPLNLDGTEVPFSFRQHHT